MTAARPRSRTFRIAPAAAVTAVLIGIAACERTGHTDTAADAPADELEQQVMRGRQLVLASGCSDCHGGMGNTLAQHYLTGADESEIVIDGRPVLPANLTPHATTGIGRYTDRQLFNALRYGLRPDATPDVVITSETPGVGNYPAQPRYLAPTMPWMATRHLSEQQIHDIIAYLRHGVNAVEHARPGNPVPPDGWASVFTAEALGPVPAVAFPTANEELADPARRDQVLRGRQLVLAAGCGVCHGGGSNPAAQGWMAGLRSEEYARTLTQAPVGPFEVEFPIGPFRTRSRNITPDNATGIGRFSERQIFNALRYGLRPGETADVEITSTTPGEGNYPAQPKYLAPPMPWPAWRHLPDDDLWAIAAYLKYGVKPVRNRVPDSEGPPDFWAAEYSPQKWGTYPAAVYPTMREAKPVRPMN